MPENELSRTAGVALSPITGGPQVDESLQTSIPGVFAAGNVLHVHDLVDYVSEEASAAGTSAAAYILHGAAAAGRALPVVAQNGVRYTVPVTVHPQAAETLTLRMRVDNVYKGKALAVYAGETCLWRRKRPVMAPGEMETVVLKADALAKIPADAANLTVTLEEV